MVESLTMSTQTVRKVILVALITFLIAAIVFPDK